MNLKFAYALSSSSDEDAETVTSAISQFQKEHLARIALPLAKILKSSEIEYLVLAAEGIEKRLEKQSAETFPILENLSAGDDDDGCDC